MFDALLDHRNHRYGRCNPAVPYLAYHLKMSARTVQRALSVLEAKGLIWTANRGGGWRYTTQWEIRSSWWFHWRAGYEQRMALRYEAAGDVVEAERRRGLAEEQEALFRAELEAEGRWMTSEAERRRLPWEGGGEALEVTPEEPAEEREPDPPAPERVEDPVPITREVPLDRDGIREIWESVWGDSWLGQVADQPRYHWPVGRRSSDHRQHQAAVATVQEHFESPVSLRRAFEGYLEREGQPTGRALPRSHGLGAGRGYGVFPHDEAPSLPKFTRSIRTWRMYAAQAGGGGPGPPEPPGWAALPAATRWRVLTYLGVTVLPPEVAATLEIPGYLDELVKSSMG